MAVAALTPRVRTIVICDAVSPSRTEDRVFTLKGVRQHLEAASFPLRAELRVYLILSSTRKGRYPGRVLIINERNDHVIRYAKFLAGFEEDNELLPLYVNMSECVFPEAGRYNFAVSFFGRNSGEALKGEQPFNVLSLEE
jgi:uncharacterized protein DUF6941